jgi:acetyl-CoA C-acetyltransferase
MPMHNTPIIIGVGEVCEPFPDDPKNARSAVDLAVIAAERSLMDTGKKEAIVKQVDAVAGIRTFSDSSPRYDNSLENVKNRPRAVARNVNIYPAYACYEVSGGQSPQRIVNEFCGRLASGEFKAALLFGGEALATVKAAMRRQVKLNWQDETDGQLDDRGWMVPGILTAQELENDFLIPGAIYGLLENARRKRLGKTLREYAILMGELLAPFSRVASSHPAAMFRKEWSLEEIASAGDKNPYLFFPYTKAMVAKDGVNQAAALVLTTVGQARHMGIDESKWIYLKACCDLKEKTILERPDLGASPAMHLAYQTALNRAGISVERVSVFDIYSCFPIAVFNACEALGLDINDPRGLTVTGGLPFFGGAGNNYSMHGIVSVVRRLREIKDGIGLVGANGGYMSKHSVGVYARQAPADAWVTPDESLLQKKLDDVPAPKIEEAPEGEAVIVSYSVSYAHGKPARAHVIGRLCNSGARFLGVTDIADLEIPQLMVEEDFLDRTIFVTSKGRGNRFKLKPDDLVALT